MLIAASQPTRLKCTKKEGITAIKAHYNFRAPITAVHTPSICPCECVCTSKQGDCCSENNYNGAL